MRYKIIDNDGKWLLETLPYNAFYFRGSAAKQEVIDSVNCRRLELKEKYFDSFSGIVWDDECLDYENGDSCMYIYGIPEITDPKHDPRLARLLADHWINISECGFFFSDAGEMNETVSRALEQWGFKTEVHITVSMPKKET